MDIEILEEKKNPLIDRTEIEFRIEHFGEGTPNRLEVRKKIAAMQGAEETLTIIKKMKNYFGASHVIGKAHAYGNVDDLRFYEPAYIRARNQPEEIRKQIHALKKKKKSFEHLFEY